MASPTISSPKLTILSSPMRHIRRLSRGGRVSSVRPSPTVVASLASSSAFDDPGGVFVSTRSLLEADELDELRKSTRTESTVSESQEQSCWSSCDKLDYHRGAPLIVTSPESGHPIDDPAAELGIVLAKSRRLPASTAFASNHVMVNNDRISQMVAPLIRLSELDAIARSHAEDMARKGEVFHSKPQEIRSSFCRASRRLGENVARGPDIRAIHAGMMNNVSDRNNLLDRRYTNMGMATARGKDDGLLYLVQVFRG
jgi:Cysteine-rich secretory protein family